MKLPRSKRNRLRISKRSRLTLSLWKYYALLIIFPTILITSITAWNTWMLREQTVINTKNLIQQSQENVDNTLAQLWNLSIQMVQRTEFQQLAAIPKNESPEYYGKLWEIKSLYEDYRNLLQQGMIMFYFNQNDVCISADHICTDGEIAYGSYFQFGNLDLQEFQVLYKEITTKIHLIAENQISFGKTTYNGVIFQYTFRLNAQNQVTLFMMVEQNYLDTLFEPLESLGTSVLLVNDTGEIVYTFGETQPASMEEVNQLEENSDYIISQTSSGYGFTYMTIISKDAILKDVHVLTVISWVLICVSIGGALLISLYISLRNSQFLANIFSQLDTGHHQNLYRTLDELVSDLKNDNDKLLHSVQESQNILRRDFYQKLLDQQYSSNEDMKIYASVAGVKENNRLYAAIFSLDYSQLPVNTDSLATLWQFRNRRCEEIRAWMGERGEAIPHGLERILVLWEQTTPVEKIPVEDILQELKQDMPLPLTVSACAAESSCDLTQLRQTVEVLNNFLDGWSLCEEGVGKILWTNQLILHTAGCILSSERINELFSAIHAGSDSVADAIFISLYQEIAVHGDTELKKELISQIRKGLLREMDNLDSDEFIRYSEILSVGMTLELFLREWIGLVCKACASRLSGRESSQVRKFKENVVRYIDQDIGNPELSLKYLADQFGFAPTYFSALFKEYMQTNLSSYLDEKRMRLANQLILESDLRLEEIARQCGYENSNTFRRAYKKYFGVNPSQSKNIR